MWFSERNITGKLTYWTEGSPRNTFYSKPTKANLLAYTPWEANMFFGSQNISSPYKHVVKLSGLAQDTVYKYQVIQEESIFDAQFKTAPPSESSFRFIVYSDPETEPESTGAYVPWPDPKGNETNRTYLLDQTTGYANNLSLIRIRKPDFIVIAGDLVEAGGEQRDWDEFWRHNTHPIGALSLASNIPIFPCVGNHEYYAGPKQGRYEQPYSEHAMAKFLTYFEVPLNQAPISQHEGRYFRADYGSITLIVLDTTNSTPHQSRHDTNFKLRGTGDPNGGHSPGFADGSTQYMWLVEQLKDAQIRSVFTFVILHHAPYTANIKHSRPPGDQSHQSTHSVHPVRALTPLFLRFGVDAVFSGHGETFTRAKITGTETLPNGGSREHVTYFYDLGSAGDGLREGIPKRAFDFDSFIAHTDSKEIWDGKRLMRGGKHYGHLEVDISRTKKQSWEAKLTPVYAFPVFDESNSQYIGFERRIYPDIIRLTAKGH